ncbi:MAG: 3-isopropylmalate dehydrogenase, partial [Treponema sp.]|nr:3-isopropylmalate dehydrogenase [Treponema sp.]
EETSCIEKACEKVLDAGYRTKDIAGSDTPESKIVGTKEMGSLVADAM